MTVRESARRLAKMTDKDLMITCGGGYGKPKQEAMLADLHALTEYVLGERESSHHGMGDDAEGGWLENLNEADDFDKDIAPRQNVDHGTVDFARAAVVKSIDEHTVAVAVLWPTGRIKMWSVFSEADAPERKSWLKTTLAAAAGLALGERADTGDLPE